MTQSMLFPLDQPIAITPPLFYDGEVEALCALLDAGAPVIHIRKPNAPASQVDMLLQRLRDRGADMARLTIHHDPIRAQQYGIGGIHLNERALLEWLQQPGQEPDTIPQTTSRQKNRAYTPRLSAPTHSWEEAARLAPLCDYIMLSPLFDSVSKPGYPGRIDPADACRKLRRRINRTVKSTSPTILGSAISGDLPTGRPVFGPEDRIIALGGITLDNVSVARAAAFDGVAAIGAIWAIEHATIDSSATLDNYQRLTRRWQASCGTLQFISDGNMTTAEAYLRGGGRWIQLRMKDTPAEKIISYGREMLTLCRHYGALLIINDDPQLAKEIGANGVHLGQNDMDPDEARLILGEQAIIGCTANTFDHITRIAQSSADYIGLGPFRYTTTKKNLSPTLGNEGYQHILSQMARAGILIPVVAIGGITIQDVPQLMKCGINGIALSGAISRAENITATTIHFTELVAAYRSIITP